MDPIAGLALVVGALAILQGWQMYQARKNNKANPGSRQEISDGHIAKLDEIIGTLGTLTSTIGRMEQRMNDCWNKLCSIKEKID